MSAPSTPVVESPEASLEKLRALLPQIRSHGVARAWLFGSRATGDAALGSDWVFLVEFDKEHPPTFDRFMGLKQYLEDELASGVDLLSRSACKPRFLQAIKSQLIAIDAA